MSDTVIPQTCKVNWVDERRGWTTFEIRVGVDLSREQYRKFADDGELWMSVWYSDAGSPILEEKPAAWFLDRSSWDAEREGAERDGGAAFGADIRWPTLEQQAAGERVTWPGSDEFCWAQPPRAP